MVVGTTAAGPGSTATEVNGALGLNQGDVDEQANCNQSYRRCLPFRCGVGDRATTRAGRQRQHQDHHHAGRTGQGESRSGGQEASQGAADGSGQEGREHGEAERGEAAVGWRLDHADADAGRTGQGEG